MDKTKTAAPCPVCSQPCDAEFEPFCSKRCKLRDLAHWLGADDPYVIPGEPYSGLVDENGERLVDLDEFADNNVVYGNFGRDEKDDDKV